MIDDESVFVFPHIKWRCIAFNIAIIPCVLLLLSPGIVYRRHNSADQAIIVQWVDYETMYVLPHSEYVEALSLELDKNNTQDIIME